MTGQKMVMKVQHQDAFRHMSIIRVRGLFWHDSQVKMIIQTSLGRLDSSNLSSMILMKKIRRISLIKATLMVEKVLTLMRVSMIMRVIINLSTKEPLPFFQWMKFVTWRNLNCNIKSSRNSKERKLLLMWQDKDNKKML